MGLLNCHQTTIIRLMIINPIITYQGIVTDYTAILIKYNLWLNGVGYLSDRD